MGKKITCHYNTCRLSPLCLVCGKNVCICPRRRLPLTLPCFRLIDCHWHQLLSWPSHHACDLIGIHWEIHCFSLRCLQGTCVGLGGQVCLRNALQFNSAFESPFAGTGNRICNCFLLLLDALKDCSILKRSKRSLSNTNFITKTCSLLFFSRFVLEKQFFPPPLLLSQLNCRSVVTYLET